MSSLLEELPIQIRSAEEQDYAFILSSWSNEVHKLKYDNFIPNSIFFPRHKAFINKVLSQSIVNVAHVDGYRDELLSYIILQPKFEISSLCIHWAHTKPLFRRKGHIAAMMQNYLQDADPCLVVTSPFLLLPQFKKKYSLIFDPTHVDNLRS